MDLISQVAHCRVGYKNFEDAWNDHLTDDALYLFYRSRQPPYDNLQACLSELETMLPPNSILMPRGSVPKQMAVQGHQDLDLDIILPKTFITYEQMAAKCANDNWEPFYELIRSVAKKLDPPSAQLPTALPNYSFDYEKILEETNGQKRQVKRLKLTGRIENLTRSIPCKFDYLGTVTDVDFFPKLICRNGLIWNVSKARTWQWSKILPRPEKIKYLDVQVAAVVLLKWWIKTFEKRCKIKSFHIALALEVSHKRSPPSMPETPFPRHQVKQVMRQILEILHQAYSDDTVFVELDNANPIYDSLSNADVQAAKETVGQLMARVDKLQ